MERKRIFAISGVKNSGKTTLICRLLEIFKDKGLKVAVLKHDGHDFVPDVPGTDTYCQLQSVGHKVCAEPTAQQFFQQANICW
mgnify:CR=1 FL=1